MKRFLRIFITCLLLVLVIFNSAGCVYLGDASSSSRTEDFEAKALPALNAHFGERYDGDKVGTSTYVVIDNQWDLNDVYELSKEDWRARGYGYSGNVSEAESTSAYPAEYFENGYLIAFAYIGSSGSLTFDCAAEKKDGGIALNVVCNRPYVQTTDIGAFIYLVPVEGKYSDETISLNLSYVDLDSTQS